MSNMPSADRAGFLVFDENAIYTIEYLKAILPNVDLNAFLEEMGIPVRYDSCILGVDVLAAIQASSSKLNRDRGYNQSRDDSSMGPSGLKEGHEKTIDELRRNHTVLEENPPSRAQKIVEALNREGIPVDVQKVDVNAYDDWTTKIDYPSRFPSYVKEFPEGPMFFKKTLEHYLSLHLIEPKPGDVYIDIASSNSVIPEILKSFYGLTEVYRQDLRYPKGIDGDKIGSDASNIPLENESVDKMALHCSLEHFEGRSDVGFVQEASRLLRVGGKVCIIPLWLSERYFIMTSRFAWEKQGIPEFDRDAVISLVEKHRLRFSRHLDAKHLKSRLLHIAELENLNWKIIHFENWQDLPRIPVFCLLLEKL